MKTPTIGGIALRALPAVAYVVFVFHAGSSRRSFLPPTGIDWEDKILHAGAFGLMHLFVLLVVHYATPRLGFARQQAVCAAAASGVGAALELHQATLPHRSAEVLDWVADTVGALLAVLVLAIASKIRTQAVPSSGELPARSGSDP